MEKVRADYDMSRHSRFVRRRTGTAPLGGTADYHYRAERQYYDDMEQARDMVRNDCVVGQIIDRATANIIQDGFVLRPETGDSRLDNELFYRWQDWSCDAEQVDIAGELTWQDIETHYCRSMLADGDIVATALHSGHVQTWEAHAVQTSTRVENTFLGVTLDQYRKRVRYWLMADAIDATRVSKTQAVGVNTRDENDCRVVFHVYNPRRVTQTRGVTALAPIFSLSGMFEDINFAKLVQQQVVSCFAIFREQTAIPMGTPPSTMSDYGALSEQPVGNGTQIIDDISPAMEVIGKPGEKLHGFSPNVPNAEFFNHVRLMLQLIGVNLGLPLCLVLMDGSETNFSGWRGAVDEARKGFKANQQNLMRRLHTPVYEWKVRQWMEEDDAIKRASSKPRVNIWRHRWTPPRWHYIEPLKDAAGDVIQLEATLTSRRRLHGDNGQDWEEIVDEQVADNTYAIEKALKAAAKLNGKFANSPGFTPIHWTNLIGLTMPKGVTLSMQDPYITEVRKDELEGGESE